MSCFFLSSMALAQEGASVSLATDAIQESVIVIEETVSKNNAIKDDLNPQTITGESSSTNTPEVGKHVMANMNAGSMLLSLLMVLALIIICALLLKRFNFAQKSISQLKVVTSLSLGAKERIMVVQVGEQQLLLGVTTQKITLLEKLSEPLSSQSMNTSELPKNILSFLSAKKS